MKFDFRIQNYDEEHEVLNVQYVPEDRALGVVRRKLSLVMNERGEWPKKDQMSDMIRRNAPVEQWQRKVNLANRTLEDLLPVIDLIGYEETGAEQPEPLVVRNPTEFPNEGVI